MVAGHEAVTAAGMEADEGLGVGVVGGLAEGGLEFLLVHQLQEVLGSGGVLLERGGAEFPNGLGVDTGEMVEAEEVPEQDPRLCSEVADDHAGGALLILGELEGGGVGAGVDAGAAAAAVETLDAGEDAGVAAADIDDEVLDVYAVASEALGGGAAVEIIQRFVGARGGLDMDRGLELDLDVGVGGQADLGELVHEPVTAGGEGWIDRGDQERRIAPLDALGGIGQVEQLLGEGLVL